MMKIYIGKLIPGKSHLPILYPNLGPIDRPFRLFFNYAKSFSEKFFEIIDDPAKADFLMIPYDYFSISSEVEYVSLFASIAEKYKKDILIFDNSDFDGDIVVSHSIVFRVSRYRHKIRPNEIIMPPIIEDLGAANFSIRQKGDMPVVGFCGWAGFAGMKDRLRYIGKIFSTLVRSITSKSTLLERSGLYFRRSAIRAVRRSRLLKNNFLIRTSYSGHKSTIELDPVLARAEYIKNIVDSDFVLAPKGDGNYSNRFYEALNMGRIPILVDTDCVLPLENEIDYDRLIVRVPWDNLDTLEQKVIERYNSLDDASYMVLQKEIRDIFTRKLAAKSFFQYVFTSKDFLNKYYSFL